MHKAMTRMRQALLTISLASLAGCVSVTEHVEASEVERSGRPGATIDINQDEVDVGKMVAQRECASCHAIDLYSSSRKASAPPLREVLAINDAEFLAYRFIEAMRVGHDEMPLFDFDVRSADALIAYIKSINSWR